MPQQAFSFAASDKGDELPRRDPVHRQLAEVSTRGVNNYLALFAQSTIVLPVYQLNVMASIT
jgi:hypothetical protein